MTTYYRSSVRLGSCRRPVYGNPVATYGDAFDDAVARIKADPRITAAWIQVNHKDFWGLEATVIVDSVKKALAMDEPVKSEFRA